MIQNKSNNTTIEMISIWN